MSVIKIESFLIKIWEWEGTREMGFVLDFFREATSNSTTTRSRSGGVDHLLDQKHIGKSTFTKLPHDPESVLVDPHISPSVNGVV